MDPHLARRSYGMTCERHPVTVAKRSKARNIFARPNIVIVGSNSTWNMDVCLGSFLCLCCALELVALRRADPVQEVLPTVCEIHSFISLLNGNRLEGQIL
jgi:hypothetical protein